MDIYIAGLTLLVFLIYVIVVIIQYKFGHDQVDFTISTLVTLNIIAIIVLYYYYFG